MDSDNDIPHIPIADFEADCLRLLDQVAQQRRPIMITRHGKPIAKLIPWVEEVTDIFGWMAGTAKICGDIIGPIEDLEWTGDEDNI
ncbi:MAG: type II toxin-antitoxin system Phd/YefM family antitoxin [Alphaproteobacteria bacterium]|nr:type II toxin-antitoxin system Phd/YefM family antitoxin [Alphaproteobacteria bacterium]